MLRNRLNLIHTLIRIFALVSCAGAVIAAAISLAKIDDIINNRILSLFINDEIRQKTQATGAVAVVAGAFIPVGAVMLILNLFNINTGSLARIIVIVDLLFIALALCACGVAGVLGAITAKDWTDDYVANIPSGLDPYTTDLRDIRNDMAATAACSLLACGSCGLLLFFIIVMLVKHNRLDYTAF